MNPDETALAVDPAVVPPDHDGRLPAELDVLRFGRVQSEPSRGDRQMCSFKAWSCRVATPGLMMWVVGLARGLRTTHRRCGAARTWPGHPRATSVRQATPSCRYVRTTAPTGSHGGRSHPRRPRWSRSHRQVRGTRFWPQSSRRSRICRDSRFSQGAPPRVGRHRGRRRTTAPPDQQSSASGAIESPYQTGPRRAAWGCSPRVGHRLGTAPMSNLCRIAF